MVSATEIFAGVLLKGIDAAGVCAIRIKMFFFAKKKLCFDMLRVLLVSDDYKIFVFLDGQPTILAE